MKNLKTLVFISLIVPLVSFMVLSNATADDKRSKNSGGNKYDSRDNNRNYDSQDSRRYYDRRTNKYYDSRDNQYRYNRTNRDRDYRRTDRGYYNYRPYRGLSHTHRRGDHSYYSGQRYYYKGIPHRYLGHYDREYWYSGPRRTYPVGKYYYDAHNQLMFSYSEGGAWFSISIGN